MSVTDVFDTLDVQSPEDKVAVTLAMQSLPATHIEEGQFGQSIYLFDDEVKKRLEKVDLPMQGRRFNHTKAMELVRADLAEHPRFIRCGFEHLGTEAEIVMIYFDFLDVVLSDERDEIVQKIHEQTGWDVEFSPTVRQDLLQEEAVHLLGRATQAPSIYLHDREVVISTEVDNQFEKKANGFKKRTGFDLEVKGSKTSSSQQESDQDIFQAKTISERMENNQAMGEAKQWAKDREITMFKTSIKQIQGESVMEIHFISPEIARRHEIDLEELSYRIGFPVTYTKNPKQNEIVQLTNRILPSHWNVRKNPSLSIDEAVVTVRVEEMPSEHEIMAMTERMDDEVGYELNVRM